MQTQVKQLWTIDKVHSEILFKVRHMMVSTVMGGFDEFEASAEADSDTFENASIRFSADVSSINTRNAQRDTHLKSEDFFHAEKHPTLTFESTSFYPKSNGKYKLTGNLTIRDTTKEVELEAEFFGTTVDPYNQTKAGFEISGKISRKEFGLTWNALTESGNVVVSDEVKMAINVQLISQ